ncbi:MAG: hypothetical protein U9N76_05055, partial [Candidatus Marinimicrobia bacterium]|nr:hypothetical protein [Candidatus Neomarinimicrobiota bacterium]
FLVIIIFANVSCNRKQNIIGVWRCERFYWGKMESVEFKEQTQITFYSDSKAIVKNPAMTLVGNYKVKNKKVIFISRENVKLEYQIISDRLIYKSPASRIIYRKS